MIISYKRIYLDFNASSPIHPQVKEVLSEGYECIGNPSSSHYFGQERQKKIEKARSIFSEYFLVDPASIIFTSGGTEANSIILNSFSAEEVLIGATEHPSLIQGAPYDQLIPVNSEGLWNLSVLEEKLRKGNFKLVCCMLANNITGVYQPLEEISRIAKKYNALVHCDCVHALGKTPISLSSLGVDSLSVSSHKIGGPLGVGALIVSEKVKIKPLFRGVGEESKRRAGTENQPAIDAFGKAVELLPQMNWSATETLRDLIETELFKAVPSLIVFSKKQKRTPNTSCLTMPGVPSKKQVLLFDQDGIALSAGSACSPSSHVLRAMNYSNYNQDDSIRVSLGWGTQYYEIESFIKSWKKIYSECKTPVG